MKTRTFTVAGLAACLAWLAPADLALAQAGSETSAEAVAAAGAASSLPAIFQAEEPLEFTIRANFRAVGKNKRKRSGLHPGVITYREGDTEREVKLRVRSRGHFRLDRCDFPPILLRFAKKDVRGTAFEGIERGRLVVHCRDNDQFEQYVLREHQLYRVWNQLTPMSHRTRLARVTYVDSASNNPITTRHAFLMEDDNVMAARNGGRIMEAKGAKVGDLDSYHDALVGVFQYMVGNVDWSVAGLHNVLLISKSPTVFATVYDFDFTGVVSTRYAVPDYRLPIKSVRQRLFRGYCAPPENFEQVFALFNEKKDAIYALYADDIGQQLSPDYVRETIKYYDDFYKIINDRNMARDRIMRACLQSQ